MSARKPLDLTVHDLEAFPHLVAKARATTRRKRLTDAELAAEYQRECRMYERARFSSLASGGSHIPAEWLNYLNRMETFKRFATHPHYDEVLP